jgi:hypothetical protein
MTVWPAPAPGKLAAGLADRRAALFTAGPRLGWVFRDRRLLAAPFPEPQPDLGTMKAAAGQRATAAETSYRKFRKWLGLPSGTLLIVLLLANGCQANTTGTGPPLTADLFALILCGPGLTIAVVKWQRARQAATAVGWVDAKHRQALTAWQQREAAWQQAEFGKLETAAEWGSVMLPGPALSIDVFGGSLSGWRALLTTHGTSLLAAQPVLVVDLTGELAGQELAQLATAAGIPVASWLLPADLGASGLLAGLSPVQFATALAEAMHAGQGPGDARADRAIDVRVLEQLHGVLGSDITPGRLAAAVRAALGHRDLDGPLSPAEQAVIAQEAFPAGYREQIEPNLIRIEAFLSVLARHADSPGGVAGVPQPPAYLTCLALESVAHSAHVEVLAALAVQWLTVQVTNSTEPAPAVIIAAADDIAAVHLERLSSACERRRVPLTLLFRHLRDTGLGILGGGAAAFMRLGNHTEAQQAADYIGRQHTFVLSQLTATLGGSQTHTTTHTEGQTVTDTINVGWNTGWNRSSSSSGQGSGESYGESRGRQRSDGRSVSRTWSTARSWADGTNWSDATASQRVYEYTVEPAVLQNLPDQALLLVTRGSGGPVLQPVECDPAIITLPRATTGPLPGLGDLLSAATGTVPVAQPACGRTSSPADTSGQGWPAWARSGQSVTQPKLPQVPSSHRQARRHDETGEA